jgi:dTDP-4-dehydrorhamnose 3,5-epimerase
MKLKPRHVEGVFEITSPPIYEDDRGGLERLYDAAIFEEKGLRPSWIQQSVSRTRAKNVLRGLHLQRPPYSEAKLVSILTGRMFWVVVDIRRGSSTFGKWEAFVLSRGGVNGFFAPRGFAHGCLSLTGDCTLVINADNYYSREYGAGIIWNDGELGIDWPLGGVDPILSPEHGSYPGFSEFKSRYGGI